MTMSSMTLRFEDDLLIRIKEVAAHFRLSKGQIARRALEAYITELEEDIEDYNKAIEVLNNSDGTAESLEDVMRECGLDN